MIVSPDQFSSLLLRRYDVADRRGQVAERLQLPDDFLPRPADAGGEVSRGRIDDVDRVGRKGREIQQLQHRGQESVLYAILASVLNHGRPFGDGEVPDPAEQFLEEQPVVVAQVDL